MKNAMKKLMAFALVAIMLVSALPFQASATGCSHSGEGDIHTVKVQLVLDGEDQDIWPKSVKNNPTTVGDLIDHKINASSIEGYTFSHAFNNNTNQKGGRELKVNCGDTVRIAFIPDTNTCGKCGAEYTDSHDCPYIACPDCGDEYDSINGEHACPTVICDECGAGYTKGTAHECAPATATCNKCDKTYNVEDGHNCKAITVYIKLDTSDNVIAGPIYKVPSDGNSAKVENLLSYCWNSSWGDAYKYDHAWRKSDGNKSLTESATVPAGDEVHIMLKTVSNNNNTNNNTSNNTNNNDDPIELTIVVGSKIVHTDDIFKSKATLSNLLNTWDEYDADDYDTDATYACIDGDKTTKYYSPSKEVKAGDEVVIYLTKEYSKLNSNKVYLHVFMNNDLDDPVKNINITTGIAADGVVDLDEDVRTLIKQYFSAKDSDGIKYDGLYVSTGDWVGDFLTDTKDEYVDNIKDLKEDGYVHLNLMITNAKLKSSSTADSTNPKTGDSIFMTVTVMTLSASALALFFFLNKKRAVK